MLSEVLRGLCIVHNARCTMSVIESTPLLDRLRPQATSSSKAKPLLIAATVVAVSLVGALLLVLVTDGNSQLASPVEYSLGIGHPNAQLGVYTNAKGVEQGMCDFDTVNPVRQGSRRATLLQRGKISRIDTDSMRARSRAEFSRRRKAVGPRSRGQGWTDRCFCAESRFPPSRRLEWTLPAQSGQPPRNARAQGVHAALQI